MSEMRVRVQHFLAGRPGFLVPLIVLAPLAVGSGTYETLFGSANGATVQKAVVLVLLVAAAVLLGFRLPPWPVWVILGTFATAFLIGAVVDDRGNGAFDSTLIRGTVGYVFPWFAFCIDWRSISRTSRAWGLSLIAPMAVLTGLLLQVFGIGTLIRHEYTGALRLAAGMPPAHLAALALFSVVGGVWLWVLGRRAGLWLALLSAAICGLTGTRGALIAAGLVLGGTLIVAICYRLPHWKVGIIAGGVGVIGAVFFILPNLLQRSSQEDHGGLALSGREEAWTYFLGKLAERPFVGYGPGGAPELSQQSGNITITRSFVSPHSAYVSLLVDVGWPLFLILAAAMVMVLVMVTVRNSGPTRWLAGLLGIACIFYGGFDNLLNAPQSAVPFALVLAMMLAAEAERGAMLEKTDDSAPLKREDLRSR